MGWLAVHSGIKNQISAIYESFTLAIQQENAVELWGIKIMHHRRRNQQVLFEL